jgi:hypothetical protein
MNVQSNNEIICTVQHIYSALVINKKTLHKAAYYFENFSTLCAVHRNTLCRLKDAGIEPWTVEEFAMTVKNNHQATSHPTIIF